MRNTDELMRDIMVRGEAVSKQRSARKLQIVYGLCACACIVLIAITAAFLPTLNEAASGTVEQHYGSLILRTPYMGYVVIGILAFACGVFATLLIRSVYVNQGKKEL